MENNTEQLGEKEQLRNNIEVVFSYARAHLVNNNPMAENELLAIMSLKSKILMDLGLIKTEMNSIKENKKEKEKK